MAKVNPITTRTNCWFKYYPKDEKLVIQCQPIKPYSAIDQVKVDSFQRQTPVFKGEEDSNDKPSV